MRKRKGTLSEDDISRAAESYRICGVYFLLWGDVVIYVGQSTDVRTRLTDHYRGVGNPYTKGFTDAYWITCERSELHALERHYIKKLDPPLNIVHTDRAAHHRKRVPAGEAISLGAGALL